jgi:hypothetical protein
MTVVFHRVKNIPLSQTPVITESESASIPQLLLAQISHHPLAVQDPQYQLQKSTITLYFVEWMRDFRAVSDFLFPILDFFFLLTVTFT